MIARYASYLMAAILPLLLFRWFTPADVAQIDFWLLWLLAMVIVALPMVYAEVALAYRSKQNPVAGMQVLTREADASILWRSFSWLAALIAIMIAALSVSGASVGMQAAFAEFGIHLQMPVFALSAGLMVIAVILSLLGTNTLPVGLLLMLVGMVLGVFGSHPTWQFAMTDTGLAEWGRAVALALVSVGAGTGIYWYAQYAAGHDNPVDAHGDAQRNASGQLYRASRQVLPIWGLQLLAGLSAVWFSSINLPPLGQLCYLLGVLCVAAYLLHYAAQQFKVKFGLLVSLAITLLLSVMMAAALPSHWLVVLLVIMSSIAALLLSVFAGWQMKISHLRKSLNFTSEGFYNLWRVAIRIVVPLSMILALVGWLGEWMG